MQPFRLRSNQLVVLRLPGMNLCLPLRELQEALQLGEYFERIPEAGQAYQLSQTPYELSDIPCGVLQFTLTGQGEPDTVDVRACVEAVLDNGNATHRLIPSGTL